MNVLKDHQHGVPQRQTLGPRNERLERLLLALLWSEGESGVSIADRYRQQVGK